MSTDRPKRNIIKKKYDDSEGIPWCEERVVRKVLFLSLREFRSGQRNPNTAAAPGAGTSTKRHCHRSTSNGGLTVKHSQRSSQNQHGRRETSEDNLDRKRPRLQAQRKFAQSQPSSPSSTPLKTTPPDPVTVAPSNYRPPKTEDFLSYLCLRGTVALPGNMAHLGSVQDDADLQEDGEKEEMVPQDGTAVSQDVASCLATNQRGKHLAKKMSNCTVLPSHGRCLRGRAAGVTRRPGEAVQGPERRERPPTSTTTDPTRLSARASTPNQLRYRCPRVPQRLPLVSMATGLSGISSSTQRAACAKRTPPLRLLPPRAARSSAPPPRPPAPPSSRSLAPPSRPPAPPSSRSLAPPSSRSLAPPSSRSLAPPSSRSLAPPTSRSLAPPSSRSLAPPSSRSLAPPSSRSLAPPNRTPALHSRSSTSRPKTRRGKKTRLSFRRRHSNSRHPKPHSRRSNHRHPSRRRPKSSPRRAPHTGSRHRPAHTHSGKTLNCTSKPSKPAAAPCQVARGQQNRKPCSPQGEPRSAGGLRQSRRRRGLPAETDSAPEVMEVRLQVSGPRTRSRTLSHMGKAGQEGAVTGRHVGKVPSKPAPGLRQAQRPASEVSALTRQAQASQG